MPDPVPPHIGCVHPAGQDIERANGVIVPLHFQSSVRVALRPFFGGGPAGVRSTAPMHAFSSRLSAKARAGGLTWCRTTVDDLLGKGGIAGELELTPAMQRQAIGLPDS